MMSDRFVFPAGYFTTSASRAPESNARERRFPACVANFQHRRLSAKYPQQSPRAQRRRSEDELGLPREIRAAAARPHRMRAGIEQLAACAATPGRGRRRRRRSRPPGGRRPCSWSSSSSGTRGTAPSSRMASKGACDGGALLQRALDHDGVADAQLAQRLAWRGRPAPRRPRPRPRPWRAAPARPSSSPWRSRHRARRHPARSRPAAPSWRTCAAPAGSAPGRAAGASTAGTASSM